MGDAAIGAAQILGDHGITDAESFDVHLVNDGIGKRGLGLGIVFPIKPGVDDDGFWNAVGAVLGIHLQGVARREVVGKDGLLPVDAAGDRLGIRVDEKFVEVETMPVFRIPGAIDAIAVKLSGLDSIHKSVPDVSGALAKSDAVDLFSLGVEEAKVDAGRGFRKNGEVCPFFIRSCAQRVGLTRQERAAHTAFDATNQADCCIERG